ncbi:NfeD family protein [uncultured Ruminococcus sp.]|uniref:NfeD family protein n=1 Tax=uncultured Ruminococcus sp. TaxID=165186 RepID=UPI00292EAEC3|nr:NfeD family protein [uncultured Ruminococcus sp.]
MSTMTIIWLVIAIVMGVLEACTVQLVSLWFAIGGVAACITSLFTDKLTIQLIVFVVVTAIALAVTRPIVKRMKQKRPEATNADRYIGKHGIVLQDIDNARAKGLVKVDNEKWTARSADGQPIKEGEDVTVTAIEGVKLIVSITKS